MVIASFQLARGAGRRQTGDADALASRGLSAILEAQVATGPSGLAARSSSVDSQYGFEESNLGRGTDRARALTQARIAGIAPHRPGGSAVDINGQPIRWNLARVIGHEIGHAYAFAVYGGVMLGSGAQDLAVDIENDIAAARDPSAQIRDPSQGHGLDF